VTLPSVDLLPKEGWHRLFTEPRRPSRIRDRPNAYKYAIAAVCVGAFMGQLDASIVTLALPSLQRDFHTSVGAVTWVGLSYLLVLVTAVTAVGRFADMVGRKLLYLYGFGVFVVGSALCALAPNLIALDCFRVLQGLGAAMLQANSVAIIYLAAPRRALGRAIGIQGAAQALGLALGPSIGGLLLGAAGWRLIFWINVPVGILGIAAGLLFIPRSLHLQRRVAFDWLGLGLFAPAIVALLVAVSFGNRLGWRSDPIIGLLWPSWPGSGGRRHPCSISRCSRVQPSRPGSPAGCSPTSSCSGRCSWSRSRSSAGRASAQPRWGWSSP
jgi:MFS family permease